MSPPPQQLLVSKRETFDSKPEERERIKTSWKVVRGGSAGEKFWIVPRESLVAGRRVFCCCCCAIGHGTFISPEFRPELVCGFFRGCVVDIRAKETLGFSQVLSKL